MKNFCWRDFFEDDLPKAGKTDHSFGFLGLLDQGPCCLSGFRFRLVQNPFVENQVSKGEQKTHRFFFALIVIQVKG
jgi:hypothetical protein